MTSGDDRRLPRKPIGPRPVPENRAPTVAHRTHCRVPTENTRPRPAHRACREPPRWTPTSPAPVEPRPPKGPGQASGAPDRALGPHGLARPRPPGTPQRSATASTRRRPLPPSALAEGRPGGAGGRGWVSDTSTRRSPAVRSYASRSAKSRPGTRPWRTASAASSATTRATVSDTGLPWGRCPRSRRCAASRRARRAPRRVAGNRWANTLTVTASWAREAGALSVPAPPGPPTGTTPIQARLYRRALWTGWATPRGRTEITSPGNARGRVRESFPCPPVGP